MTDEERRALAYILADPDAWLENTVKHLSPRKAEEAIAHKIKKALVLVEGVSDEDYTTRTERDALAEAEMQPTPEQVATAREMTQAGMEADLTAAKRADLYLAVAEIEKQLDEFKVITIIQK